MSTPAHVAIVIPLFNDEEWVTAALESCCAQTLAEIEVLCVDDCSSDGTARIVEEFAGRDPRVRLVRQPSNASAFQARRAGVMAATAPYVLFLDGDDELAPTAAQTAVATARRSDADLVGFGVEVLLDDGRTVAGYQSRLAPVHESLSGDEVLRGLFPVGKAAQGQLWRYLFRTTLLLQAYAAFPEDLVLPRINDLPLTFLAVAQARSYVSIQDRLYRYYFRRGGSGHRVEEISRFAFYLGAMDSVEALEAAVDGLQSEHPDPEQLRASVASARLAVIANVLRYLHDSVAEGLQAEAVALLEATVPAEQVVQAAVEFYPPAVESLARHGRRIELGTRPVRSVLLSTKALQNGGVSGVLLSQARFLLAAGCRVTIAVSRPGSITDELPDGVRFVELSGSRSARLAAWAELCREESVDVIIDHQVLYSRAWPGYALMARAVGVPTIGWIHNFSLRPVYTGNDLLTFLQGHLGALAQLVTLSPLDVAFWKLRGIEHTAYLPNPPSPMLLESAAQTPTIAAPGEPLRLVWWGRLEQRTKQVRQLVAVAVELRRLGVDFRLTIVGPDWTDMTAEELRALVAQRHLEDQVAVVGPRRGAELIETIDAADLFITTSIIEGYQLTIAEAQARGLPVVMYELPWLAVVADNDGIVAVPQGDAAGLAREVRDIAADPERYRRLAEGSLVGARRAAGYDFARLYRDLVAGTLPAEFSPEPTLDDAAQLLQWMVFYTERSASTPTPPAGTSAAVEAGRPRLLGRVARRVLRAFPALMPIARRVQRARGRA
ncbi:glycosyltransferase [Nocardioides sp.]|uniref:glycosyltransferase n=1 Tax=Nocardioides sp. TaxID=35761 RepID=UPI00262CF937|nr:glycosyltransferase [Nocardioides sp.]